VRHWKPAGEVYHHAAQTVGIAANELGLIAAHSWDIHGASKAGLVTGYVSGVEKQFLPLVAEPDISGGTLLETAQNLLALPIE
jgi:2-haloacid dehalogenase